jgi:hypothetical protein
MPVRAETDASMEERAENRLRSVTMRGLAIVKVSCPHCGAPVAIDPWTTVWTCGYCKNRSYVHRPNAPAAPEPGAEHYGHIHVSPGAMQKAQLLLLVFGVAGILCAAGIIVAVFLAAAPTRMSPPAVVFPVVTSIPVAGIAPTEPAAPSIARIAAAGPVCEKVVRCCRVVSPGNKGCDGMGILSEQLCAEQLSAMQAAARAQGKRCD